MGTVIEKIFSRKMGYSVKAGDYIICPVDASMIQDINGPSVIEYFNQLDVPVLSPNKHMIVLDHFSPCPNIHSANQHKILRRFAHFHHIHLVDQGQGICHQMMLESGLVLPGSVCVGTDSHATTYGALNALGTSVGAAEAAVILASNKCWFRVPKTIRILFVGKPSANIFSKDLALAMIAELTQSGAVYHCLEFGGEALSHFSVDSRAVISNMAIETGAKGAIMPYDQILDEWFALRGITGIQGVESDPDAVFEKNLIIDVSRITPQVAVSPEIDNVRPVSELAGLPVQQVVIGSCTNGRYEDFKVAATILKGKKIHKDVRLLVLPASREIVEKMMESGVYDTLLKSGAMIFPPGCGPCAGIHGGLIGDEEVVVSTTNRNSAGRMGSPKGQVYITSPFTAAWTAIHGYLSDGGCSVD